MLSRRELFEKTKKLWPAEIDTSEHTIDGVLIKGGQIENEIYNKIESSLDKNNHWMQISCWSLHQAIIVPNSDVPVIIFMKDVSFDCYQQMMLQNLNGDECWKFEFDIYRNLKIE